MTILFDLHTHTAASGHAFSTLKENIEAARDRGLTALGTSDHPYTLPAGAPHTLFRNYGIVRSEIFGVRILKGLEADILNTSGKLDIPDRLYPNLDYVIASMHTVCHTPGTTEENTLALINAMKNPHVKIIGHPDDERYAYDYERLVLASKAISYAS